MQNQLFKSNYWKYQRLNSQTIQVGNIEMGAKNPIRIQSMANTSTHNVEASVKQAIEIIEAGGELVRYAVVNNKDAEALKDIKESLIAKGYSTPIVADVHFNPNLADIAAKYVDKVRINPGNYLDKRATFADVNFTDEQYKQELERLEDRFVSFLNICKKHQTAIRIGTNHGSLSDRIMSRYGDTPEGMVEATMEFLRICKNQNFFNVVVSLKSSNTRVMIHAFRWLALQMKKEQMHFALHLGVTEAGSGSDGRIKSAVGIGALLQDGLGDTIRVSLTESPAKEIPVAKQLVSHFKRLGNTSAVTDTDHCNINFYNYKAREIHKKFNAQFKQPLVISDLASLDEISPQSMLDLGFEINETTDELIRTEQAPDIIFAGEKFFPFSTKGNVSAIIDCKYWDERCNGYPLFALEEYKITQVKSPEQNWVQITHMQLDAETIKLLKNDETLVLVCFSYHKNYVQELKAIFNILIENNIKTPVIIQQSYTELEHDTFKLKSAADLGVFFIDGLAQGIWLKNTFKESNQQIACLSFDILQASRARTTKTEYISCPSCGRTLFDLEKSLEEVKQATTHLKGLKIAVMGCIVNGPGEMADADYGYVGAGPGKVSLYKGKNLVKRNVDSENAVKELLNLIEGER
ncbi:MAG: (E)-4-hydroxy-3-methylbut-2-enyl-diphosphate synthase [Salinivirgaceae bacterium]|nr:(E)-4-hydroxy-3-methylbut-2-enyl-diphosphate synthase [Salinivirgaceae bacterium]